MAPTEGRVARPERRWDCRRRTPIIWICLSDADDKRVYTGQAQLEQDHHTD